MKFQAILFAMSHLSDAQELILMGNAEEANVRINFAKYLMIQLRGKMDTEIDPDVYWRDFCADMGLEYYDLKHKVFTEPKGLRFTTSRPRAFGFAGEPLVLPTKRGDLYNFPDPNDLPAVRVHIHGKAEVIAGYDVPIFIDGNLEELFKLDKANITMLLPTEEEPGFKEVACITKKGSQTEDFINYYIVLKDEN